MPSSPHDDKPQKPPGRIGGPPNMKPPPTAGRPPGPGGPPPAASGGTVDEDKEERRGNMRNCCKKSLKFLFSHIGLCGMVIAYSIAGGFIFQHLEKTNEKQECMNAFERYDQLENSTKYNLWEISTHFRNDEDLEYALVEYEKQLVKFRDDVLALGYDGKNCTKMGEEDGPGYRWSFPGALLFSVTVITTIGYGNIAPKTFWGRLVCIAYATLGIPLMLLCLANIGDVMADIFRFIYTKVCCCGCCRKKDKNKVESLQDKGNPGKAGDGKGAGTPEAWKNQYAATKGLAPPPEQKGPVVIDDDDDDDDEDEDKISVPLTITLGVIGGYIFMGALLFGVWEKWDPLKASYFCFVTISTIGFGDVVPGSADFQATSDQYKMVGAAIYMLFGMAILSMCFSLIQEEIVAKFRWVGEKIGIIEKDSDKDDDDDEDDDEKDDKKGRKEPPKARNDQQPLMNTGNQRNRPPGGATGMPPPPGMKPGAYHGPIPQKPGMQGKGQGPHRMAPGAPQQRPPPPGYGPPGSLGPPPSQPRQAPSPNPPSRMAPPIKGPKEA